jgi:hypothetical protein
MHSFLVSSRRAIPTVLWAFCPPVLQLVFCLCGQDAHTTVGGFLCSLGILPAVLQLNLCPCGQDAHTTVGGFFM